MKKQRPLRKGKKTRGQKKAAPKESTLTKVSKIATTASAAVTAASGLVELIHKIIEYWPTVAMDLADMKIDQQRDLIRAYECCLDARHTGDPARLDQAVTGFTTWLDDLPSHRKERIMTELYAEKALSPALFETLSPKIKSIL